MSYDIFHLSYQESFSDETYKTLKDKFPWAKRVKGVKAVSYTHLRAHET